MSNFSTDSSLRSYAKATDMQRQGAVFLRPWHLVYSAESGVKGLLEQDRRVEVFLTLSHQTIHIPFNTGSDPFLMQVTASVGRTSISN